MTIAFLRSDACWTPKVCKMKACRATFTGLGQLFYILMGSQQGLSLGGGVCLEAETLQLGHRDFMNIRILHPGSNAQEGD